MKMLNEYKFTVAGGIDVHDAKEVKSYDGHIIGFKLPDGTTIKPIIAFEVEQDNKYRYITSESAMNEINFFGLDYSLIEFNAQMENENA
jgi:hypothetical protein